MLRSLLSPSLRRKFQYQRRFVGVAARHRRPCLSSNNSTRCLSTTSEAIASNVEDVKDDEDVPLLTRFQEDPNAKPTLEDLERYKPKNRPNSNSPEYAEAYRWLANRLCNSFRKDQLRQFYLDYETPGAYIGKGRRKIDYAHIIMEKHWGWENLKELERRKRDRTEVVSKDFKVSRSDLFLLMGRDGMELHELTKTYNVNIFVQEDPLSLRIQGLRGAIKEVEALFASKRKSIVQKTVDLSSDSPLSQSLLQHLSHVSNAYLSSVGKKPKVLIHAMSQSQLDNATRIIYRAEEYVIHSSHVPLFISLPSDGQENFDLCALFPFSSNTNPHWTTVSGQAFKCRSINKWTGDMSQILYPYGPNAMTLNTVDVSGNAVDVEQLLEWSLPKPGIGSKARNIQVFASTGHYVYSHPDAKSARSIVPPVTGQQPYLELLQQVKDLKMQGSFAESFPGTSLNGATNALSLYRLLYRTRTHSSNVNDNGLLKSDIVYVEIFLNEQGTVYDTKLSKGQEVNFVLAQPSRSTDFFITVRDASLINSKDAGSALSDYLKELMNAQSDERTSEEVAPMTISIDGLIYFLETNETVRQIRLETPTAPFTSDEFDSSEAHKVESYMEDILDVDTDYKYVKFCVASRFSYLGNHWRQFIQECNAVTNVAHHTGTIAKSGNVVI